MVAFFAWTLFAILVAWQFGYPLWVLCTARPSDLTRVRAEYEGLQGRAGPNVKILSIERSGGGFGGRTSAPYRSYDLELQLPTGETRRKTVRAEAPLLGGGSVCERAF
jgi:hypothetical protein